MLAGKIMAICISGKRGMKKSSVPDGILIAGHGLSGDAHAGPGRRQVSLLAFEDVAAENAQYGIQAGAGDFAENILTVGIDLEMIPVNAMIHIGGAIIRITERGKPEHKTTDYNFKGVALLAKKGLFAEVAESGAIHIGDSIFMPEKYPNGRTSDADIRL